LYFYIDEKGNSQKDGTGKGENIAGYPSLGVTVGCWKNNIGKACYNYWLDRYNAHSKDVLENCRAKDMGVQLKNLEKENLILKDLLAEKDLESEMKDELLKLVCTVGGKKRNSVLLCWQRAYSL
jgi:hypothetical protein